jgi:hypothetical protein
MVIAPPSHLFPGLVLEENGVHPDRAGRIRHKDLEDMEGLPSRPVGPRVPIESAKGRLRLLGWIFMWKFYGNSMDIYIRMLLFMNL